MPPSPKAIPIAPSRAASHARRTSDPPNQAVRIHLHHAQLRQRHDIHPLLLQQAVLAFNAFSGRLFGTCACIRCNPWAIPARFQRPLDSSGILPGEDQRRTSHGWLSISARTSASRAGLKSPGMACFNAPAASPKRTVLLRLDRTAIRAGCRRQGIATADAINDAGQRPRSSLRAGSIASQQQRTEHVMVGADHLALGAGQPPQVRERGKGSGRSGLGSGDRIVLREVQPQHQFDVPTIGKTMSASAKTSRRIAAASPSQRRHSEGR